MSDLSELNRQVAEKIMGWEKLDRKAKGWGDGPEVFRTHDLLNPSFQGFEPTTNASHDYMILKHIRATWGLDMLNHFMSLIVMTWAARNPVPPIEQTFISYQPGDYGKAALIAMEE